MSKFNVGDVVRCIDDSMQYCGLVHGNLYETRYCDSTFVKLVGIKDNGGFYHNRFELAKPLDIPAQPVYNEYSLTELLNRIKLSQQIAETHIEDHHLGHLAAKDVMLAQGHLENAYNKISALQKKD